MVTITLTDEQAITLTDEQAIAVIRAIEIIQNDTTHDSLGDSVQLWKEFDYQMCLDDLIEAKLKIKEGMA